MLRSSKDSHLTVALFCIFYSEVTFAVVDVETEVNVGDSAFLSCPFSDGSADVSWLHYPLGSQTKYHSYVYTRGYMNDPYDKRFRVETKPGSHILVITEAVSDDAGVYVCQVKTEPEQSTTFQLIVLDSGPKCQSNIKDTGLVGPNDCHLKQETIQMSCGITYKGNVAPKLQWKQLKDDKSFTIDNNMTSCDTVNNSITCNYSTKANVEIDGSSFVCQTPSSPYSCSTNVVKTLYAIGDMKPKPAVVGDTVTCSLNTSSAVCNFTWSSFGDSDENSLVTTNDRVLSVTRGWHICEATCNIRDFQCTIYAMTIAGNDVTTCDSGDCRLSEVIVTLGGIFGGMLLGSFITLAIMKGLHYYEKQTAKKKRSKEERFQNSEESKYFLSDEDSKQSSQEFVAKFPEHRPPSIRKRNDNDNVYRRGNEEPVEDYMTQLSRPNDYY